MQFINAKKNKNKKCIFAIILASICFVSALVGTFFLRTENTVAYGGFSGNNQTIAWTFQQSITDLNNGTYKITLTAVNTNKSKSYGDYFNYVLSDEFEYVSTYDNDNCTISIDGKILTGETKSWYSSTFTYSFVVIPVEGMTGILTIADVRNSYVSIAKSQNVKSEHYMYYLTGDNTVTIESTEVVDPEDPDNPDASDEPVSTGGVTVKKDVKCVNWDDRIYQIDLYAANNEQTQTAKPLKVALSLDFSGSMDEAISGSSSQTKYEALRDCVKEFVSSLPENAYITINTFNKAVTSSTNLTLRSDIKDVDTYVNQIFIEANKDTGTNQYLGLKECVSKLGSITDEDTNVIVLFTDGEPGGPNVTIDADYIKSYITENINSKPIDMYAVGIFGSDDSEGEANLNSWVGADHAYIATDASSLASSFQEIVTTISGTIQADVADVIDSRFTLYNSTSDYTSETEEADISDQTIYWADQSLSYCADMSSAISEGTYTGWHKTIYVQANEDYIGGNNITTNTAESGVYATEDETQIVAFPQPTVNVKINLNDQETVLFADDYDSDMIPSVNELYTYTIGNTAEEGDTPGETPSTAATLVTADFDETGWTDSSGNAIDVGELPALLAKDGTYQAGILYNKIGTATEESNTNTTINGVIYQNNAENQSLGYCDYDAVRIIHVVSGQIDLSKIMQGQYTEQEIINSNQTFIFKIERYAVTTDAYGNEVADTSNLLETFYETLSFDGDADGTEDGTAKSSTITNLKKGFYTITEETVWSDAYNLTQKTDNYVYNDNSEECVNLFIGQKLSENTSDGDGVPVFFGLKQNAYTDAVSGKSIATGEAAECAFTNEKKSEWNWFSDVASAWNKFWKEIL